MCEVYMCVCECVVRVYVCICVICLRCVRCVHMCGECVCVLCVHMHISVIRGHVVCIFV